MAQQNMPCSVSYNIQVL